MLTVCVFACGCVHMGPKAGFKLMLQLHWCLCVLEAISKIPIIICKKGFSGTRQYLADIKLTVLAVPVLVFVYYSFNNIWFESFNVTFIIIQCKQALCWCV